MASPNIWANNDDTNTSIRADLYFLRRGVNQLHPNRLVGVVATLLGMTNRSSEPTFASKSLDFIFWIP